MEDDLLKELYLGVDLSYLPEGALNALKKFGDTSINNIIKEDERKEEPQQEGDAMKEAETEKISDSEESEKSESPVSPPHNTIKVVESPVNTVKLVGGKSVLTEDIKNTSSKNITRKT
jgi:hypothetical protein